MMINMSPPKKKTVINNTPRLFNQDESFAEKAGIGEIKAKGRGTGLGLSVSYDIIDNHRRDIQVESEIGKGTIFMVFIPVAA